MTLKADLSGLPSAAPQHTEGLTPDPEPRFVQVLAETWMAEDVAAGEKPRATETATFRHSDAGKCARAVSYAALNLPASDPMDLCGINNVRIGSLVHDAWQAAMSDRFGAAFEAEVTVSSLDGRGAGHVDGVLSSLDDDDQERDRVERVTAFELKTIGGFGFKAAIGRAGRGSVAEGPKAEHILQGAISAVSLDADELVVAYIGKEAISVNMARGLDEVGRFAAEWTFTREQFEPLATDELARVAGILDLVESGLLPKRTMPDLPRGAEIVDVTKGRWEQHSKGQLVDTGTVWNCGYCRHQTLCGNVGAGRQPAHTAVGISARLRGAA